MEKLRIIIADDDNELSDTMDDFFNEKGDLEVVGIYNNGDTLLETLKDTQVDLLILDIFMPLCDGIKVLKELQFNKDKYKIPSSIITITAFNNENILKLASNYGADYLILKPLNFTRLYEVILELKLQIVDSIKNQNSNDLDTKITNILHKVGIPAQLKGYLYLREAINIFYNNSNVLGNITKVLYPEIALKYNTTSARVERSIRHAIEVAWLRGNRDYIKNIFRCPCHKSHPSNSEFIALITERLQLKAKVNR